MDYKMIVYKFFTHIEKTDKGSQMKMTDIYNFFLIIMIH